MVNTMTEAFNRSFEKYADNIALQHKNKKNSFDKITYKQADEISRNLSLGLIGLGIKKDDKVGLIADVSHLWMLADMSMQRVGLVDVPRGTDSTGDEIAYILNHAGCKTTFVHTAKEVDKIEKGLTKLNSSVERYIIMDDSNAPKAHEAKCVGWSELVKKGAELNAKGSTEVETMKKWAESVKAEDLATLIYTSGTTGEPKGVMLTHGNLSSQLNRLPKLLDVSEKDIALTLLPPWHIFGRTAEYLVMHIGGSIAYTDVKSIGEDMRHVKPTFIPAVPRIWEGVYNKILAGVKKSGKEDIFKFFRDVALKFKEFENKFNGHVIRYEEPNPFEAIAEKAIGANGMALLWPLKALGDNLVFSKLREATGGNLRFSISGGGALPGYVDDFFAAIGIKIIEGYGLTETSPVLSARLPDRIIPGTVGPALADTEIKVIDDAGYDVTGQLGKKGTLHVRGPQVMQGYYKNPEKTQAVLTEDGWFNTGDLVLISTLGDIRIVGRSKDTIVLVGGENVEPTPIEEKLKESPFVDHVMCVGQDKKSIGALIVPNEEELKTWAQTNNIAAKTLEELVKDKDVYTMFKKEVQKLVSYDNGFKNFERITDFRLLTKPFEKGVELNNTLKLRRHVVADIYAELIEEIYS